MIIKVLTALIMLFSFIEMDYLAMVATNPNVEKTAAGSNQMEAEEPFISANARMGKCYASMKRACN
ncbi:hypothetical protein MTYP_02112 [Methylophilaceae bacterium]|nr:hypothetical protein MTYP_02112 [Methylophilaceae bacterium]